MRSFLHQLLRLTSLTIFFLGFLTLTFQAKSATVLVGDPGSVTDGTPLSCGDASNPCNTITNGISRASTGDTVLLAPGLFFENVIIDKPLILQGSGQTATTLSPALSSPVCIPSPGSSLCGGSASSLILVDAPNVTIRNLSLDGDNPGLLSGTTIGGADIDARNGIITNNLSSSLHDNLEVNQVTVRNVFLRGIYASNGGSFNFHDNTVTNVRGNDYSIAIFNFGGTGVIQNNQIFDSADAIASNWSGGTQYLNNKINNSGSGIHSDNAGGSASSSYPNSTPDLIQGNQVQDCSSVTPNSDTFGIFVWSPYNSPILQNNSILRCSVGMAVFGKQDTATPSFISNLLQENKMGFFMTTLLIPNGSNPLSTNVSATLNQNTIVKNSDGIYLQAENGFQLSLAGSFNRIVGNLNSGASFSPGDLGDYLVQIENNWWGCNAGPNAVTGSCDSVVGNFDFNPWLILNLSASTNTVTTGATSILSASVNSNSDGGNNLSGFIPNDTSILFSTTLGDIETPPNRPTQSGLAQTTFTAPSASGSAILSATLDQQTVTLPLEIILPEPSNSDGQSQTTDPSGQSSGADSPETGTPATNSSGSHELQGGGTGCQLASRDSPVSIPSKEIFLWMILVSGVFWRRFRTEESLR